MVYTALGAPGDVGLGAVVSAGDVGRGRDVVSVGDVGAVEGAGTVGVAGTVVPAESSGSALPPSLQPLRATAPIATKAKMARAVCLVRRGRGACASPSGELSSCSFFMPYP
jgi:hypothetical protein